MHFGENQLSRSLISLSPLPTAHPLSFQPKWVRASTTSYRRFTLVMGRSLRFGSRTCHSDALFGLAFATASPHGLTLPRTTNSQAHSSKGTPSPRRAPTDCRQSVSGTISLPSRGTFHHSLTVLSAIGHQGVFRLTGWSRQIHSGFHGPAATWEHKSPRHKVFRYGTLTLYGRPFQVVPLTRGHQRLIRQNQDIMPHNTTHATPAGSHTHAV